MLGVASFMDELRFLDFAKGKAEEARAKTGLESIQANEEIVAEANTLSPGSFHTYGYDMVVAGAHLDAARERISYGASLANNLSLTEQNKKIILDHLHAVPALVVDAANRASGSVPLEHFRCQAYKMLASGAFFQGVTANSARDLQLAVGAFEKVSACDPASKREASKMISYIKGVEREMSHAPFRADNVVKVASKFIGLALPGYGSYLAAGLDFGYGFYKERKKAPEPPR